MRFVSFISLCVLLVICRTEASAQHWTKVLSVPSVGSAGAFTNADHGCIGTGDYSSGAAIQIWFTSDGGAHWTRSLLPNMRLYGQVTDMAFRDELNGWATIQESIEHGWSGLYRTYDGGRTWQLWTQATFPVSIRITGRGIFYVERYAGIKRSTDDGLTFTNILFSGGALGLDFMNDNVGIMTTEGDPSQPYYTTVDGGQNWLPYQARRESWGAFADPASKKLFFSSEHDIPYPGSQSFVGMSSNFGVTFQQSYLTDSTDGLTGGISGARGCRSVVYIQRQYAARGNTNLDDGMLRSTDGGLKWVPIGGPYNYNDKRFAVTGRGAVVYAFDHVGGIWKTSDGGDGTLTPSVLNSFKVISIGSSGPLNATVCDSASVVFKFNYADCDSVSIIGVGFPDDSLHELSSPHRPRFFGYGGSSVDSVTIRFKPVASGTNTRTIRFSIRQADGFIQDTIVTITINAFPAPEKLSIAEVVGDSLGFGVASVCGGDSVRTITISNLGCTGLSIVNVQVLGTSFSLRSGFTPFVLDPGFSKQYLLRYKATLVGQEAGALVVTTATQSDTTSLRGIGKAGQRLLVLSQPTITSTICDSALVTIHLRNLSCSFVRIDSMTVPDPYQLGSVTLPVSIPTDSQIAIPLRFVPSTPGTYSFPIVVHGKDINEAFDTSLTVTAVATEGTASYSYSPDHIDFGSVSVCSAREFTVTVVSTGCDTLEIPMDTLGGADTAAFHLTADVSTRRVLGGDTVRITVRFHPFVRTTYNTTLHITTNVGMIDIPMTGTGSSDPGVLSLGDATLGTVLTCNDTTFAIRLENTTCDSLVFDSLRIEGIASADFAITANTPQPLAIGNAAVLGGRFAPLTGGSRDAILHCYLHKSDGSTVEVTSQLHGDALQPQPVRITLNAGAITSVPGSVVSIPVEVLDTCYVDVRTVRLVLKLNTDLLTPTAFVTTGSIMQGMSISSFATEGDTASVLLDIPPGQRLASGLFGTMICSTYVADTNFTPITIATFDLQDANGASECLPTTLATQSPTSFTLMPECGTNVLEHYLQYGPSAIHITGIVPNPAHRTITLRARVRGGLGEPIVIDIINDAGAIVQSQVVQPPTTTAVISVPIILEGASGPRTVRMRSGSFEANERFLYLK